MSAQEDEAPVPDLPQSDVLSTKVSGGVATVWLDRPDKLNAFGMAFWVDFPAVIAALSGNPSVRVIVVAGRGPAFTVGLDLKEFATTLHGDSVAHRMELYERIKRMQGTFSSLAESSKPVIVVTHGWCIGAGVDLITAADIRIAAADAVFSIRETKIAMVADVGTLQRLPSIIGPGNVADLVYSGRDIDAAEAKDMGLVSRVLPDQGEALDAAMALAAEIAANSPLAVEGAKKMLRNSSGMSLDERLDYVALWNAAFLHSEDFSEAFKAFAEKRRPKFKGT